MRHRGRVAALNSATLASAASREGRKSGSSALAIAGLFSPSADSAYRTVPSAQSKFSFLSFLSPDGADSMRWTQRAVSKGQKGPYCIGDRQWRYYRYVLA